MYMGIYIFYVVLFLFPRILVQNLDDSMLCKDISSSVMMEFESRTFFKN